MHWYTRREPHVGKQAIAENAALGVGAPQRRIGTSSTPSRASDEVAIEWTMAFDHPTRRDAASWTGAPSSSAFRGDLICEVRA